MPKIKRLIGISLLFASCEAPVWAIQEHPYPEGFIAHQLAHIFFMGAMLLFVYRLRKTGLAQRPHWNKLCLAAVILAVWNVWAFGGHLVSLRITPDVFLPQGGHIEQHFCQKGLVIKGVWEILYLIFKNDNLLTIPAFFLIYSSVQKMERLLRGKE